LPNYYAPGPGGHFGTVINSTQLNSTAYGSCAMGKTDGRIALFQNPPQGGGIIIRQREHHR